MDKTLNKLLGMLGVGYDAVTYTDGETHQIRVPLGRIDAGTYSNGLWGDVELLDTDAVLGFTCGDLYGEDEFVFGEGTVDLDYAPGNTGLAYSCELEDLIVERIRDLTGLDASGSEQGMQGDDYLSLDIWCKDFETA